MVAHRKAGVEKHLEREKDSLVNLISFNFMTEIKLAANAHNTLPCVFPVKTSALMCRHHAFHAASSTITPHWIIASLHHKEHSKTSRDTPHPYSQGSTDRTHTCINQQALSHRKKKCTHLIPYM